MRLVSLGAALALAGCPSWRSVPVRSIDDVRAMIFTDTTAYDLSSAHVRGDAVIGTPVHAWHITTCEYDATESPTHIANHCRWPAEPTPSTIALDRSTIRNVHVLRGYQRDIAIIAAATLTTALVLLGVLAWEIEHEEE